MRENRSYFAALIIVALAAPAAALLLVVALVIWLSELMGSIILSVGTTISLGTNSAHKNTYILSGWIKLAQDNGSDTIDLTVANSSISSGTTLHLPTPPVGKWTYFAIAFPWTQSTICVKS